MDGRKNDKAHYPVGTKNIKGYNSYDAGIQFIVSYKNGPLVISETTHLGLRNIAQKVNRKTKTLSFMFHIGFEI